MDTTPDDTLGIETCITVGGATKRHTIAAQEAINVERRRGIPKAIGVRWE
jgi:hypothetical protein